MERCAKLKVNQATMQVEGMISEIPCEPQVQIVREIPTSAMWTGGTMLIVIFLISVWCLKVAKGIKRSIDDLLFDLSEDIPLDADVGHAEERVE